MSLCRIINDFSDLRDFKLFSRQSDIKKRASFKISVLSDEMLYSLVTNYQDFEELAASISRAEINKIYYM